MKLLSKIQNGSMLSLFDDFSSDSQKLRTPKIMSPEKYLEIQCFGVYHAFPSWNKEKVEKRCGVYTEEYIKSVPFFN